MARLLTFLWFAVLAGFARADDLVALVYHDIAATHGTDEYVLTEEEFEAHLRYLRDEGYQPVRLDDLEAAREGRRPLPKQPVLITFDDGLRSYRDKALPLLKRYGYPSVLAVMSQWVDGRDVPDAYRDKVMGWEELRTLVRDPLVEIASHTHALHEELPVDPYGGRAPAAVARVYDSVSRRYESEAEFGGRLKSDLMRSRDRIAAELKRSPRALAWPFGEYDGVGMEAAAALGFAFQFTLDDEPNRLASLPRIHRVMLRRSHGVSALQEALRGSRWSARPVRFLHAHLSDFADATDTAGQQRFMPLLRQAELLNVNTVVIAPVAAKRRALTNKDSALADVAETLGNLRRGLRDVGVRHVYFDLSAMATLPPPGELAELLTRVRIQGVIFGKDDRLVASVRRLQPRFRLGTTTHQGSGWADFLLEKVDTADGPAALRQAAHAAAGRVPRTLLLVTGQAASDPRELAEQLRGVRTEGARDFGVDFAILPGAGSDSIQIALELAGHVAVRP